MDLMKKKIGTLQHVMSMKTVFDQAIDPNKMPSKHTAKYYSLCRCEGEPWHSSKAVAW
jgi:hypothetical protein